ncbi:MAG: hypothetical protein JJU02_13405 [Cryomorphaceae bacterium]|nr:hypothetical protein [Cryomorphaceae bacterium]
MKQFITLITLVLASLSVQAQMPKLTIVDSVDIPFEQQMDSLFKHLDLSDVTTGLLLNRSFPTIDISLFDGTGQHDTLHRWENFMASYGTLNRAAISSVYSLPNKELWKENVQDISPDTNIPIGIMNYSYHHFKPDSALVTSLIYESGGKLYDQANQSESPYTSSIAFVACPVITEFSDTAETPSFSLSFMVDSTLMFTNTGEELTEIEINFDDGLVPYHSNPVIFWQEINSSKLESIPFPLLSQWSTRLVFQA